MRAVTLVLSLLIAAPLITAPVWSQGVDDARFQDVWHGTLDTGGPQLRLEVEITAEGSVMTSLDQGNAQIPASGATVESEALTLSFAPAPITMQLELTTPDTLVGSFTQGPGTLPLTLTRGATPADTPLEIIGTDTDVSIESGEAILAGSLRLPPVPDQPPVILLLNGSGPQDRDATVAGQRVFGVLADALASRGIASLRLDDRGVGGSSAIAVSSPHGLAEDAVIALETLRERDDVDTACVALLGHSEGGLIAFLAAQNARPDFIITLAGMHGTMADTLYEQSEALILASGGGQAGADANRALQDAMFAAMRTASEGEAGSAIEAALIERGFPAEAAAQQAAIWGQPYAVAALDLDPREAMAAYDGPVHAFFGERDLQVLAEPNAARLLDAREGLPTEITVIEGVNHLFQDSETGLPGEYATASHAMSPASLDAIGEAAEALIGAACR
tara:strand:+ start:5518 stop:6864 length:1347 start_codon:yes stop_codon:yes gene_type:complete